MNEQITSIFVTALISVLVIIVAFMRRELTELKEKAGTAVDEALPDDWQWIARDAAYIAVRAAYQLFPKDQTEKMLQYGLEFMCHEIGKAGFEIGDDDRIKIRAILEAAVADFYASIGKPELLGA